MTLLEFITKGFKNNNIIIDIEELLLFLKSYKIDSQKSTEDLSESDFVKVGRVLTEFFNKKNIISDLDRANFTIETIEDSNLKITLEQRTPQENDPFAFALIYDLIRENYFENEDEILNKIFNDYLIKSHNKYNFKLKPNINNINKDNIRQSEYLLVIYQLENYPNKIYYYTTNEKTPSYDQISKFLNK
ncbi:hypothetical protein [Sphingobacterium lactis]|uniref:Uncharacterized protein n=1 Tax=Sphingobacterium lactis TaxID=797291 RepID=A0A1H5VJE5_9SPHI|nr:hypothetical protein [Sphingobacterium lactis]SEF87166.1 hypothetical protein SAMN05421877_103145 [Sphingobacterium lactis]